MDPRIDKEPDGKALPQDWSETPLPDWLRLYVEQQPERLAWQMLRAKLASRSEAPSIRQDPRDAYCPVQIRVRGDLLNCIIWSAIRFRPYRLPPSLGPEEVALGFGCDKAPGFIEQCEKGRYGQSEHHPRNAYFKALRRYIIDALRKENRRQSVFKDFEESIRSDSGRDGAFDSNHTASTDPPAERVVSDAKKYLDWLAARRSAVGTSWTPDPISFLMLDARAAIATMATGILRAGKVHDAGTSLVSVLHLALDASAVKVAEAAMPWSPAISASKLTKRDPSGITLSHYWNQCAVLMSGANSREKFEGSANWNSARDALIHAAVAATVDPQLAPSELLIRKWRERSKKRAGEGVDEAVLRDVVPVWERAKGFGLAGNP